LKLAIGVLVAAGLACVTAVSALAAEDLREELKKVPYKIVYETYRDGNWELYQINGDGLQPVNLTQTPNIHECFPQVSPDGSKIAFIADEGEGDGKVRSVWLMNRNGTGRTLVAKHARWPFWNRTGTGLCYIPDEKEQFNVRDPAGKGLCVYDVATRRATPHPNPELEHLYNLCWTPDAKWILATVSGAMGHNHAILAIAARGKEVLRLNYADGNRIGGCRPDISPDGKRIAWNSSDYTISVANLDFSGPGAKALNHRILVKSQEPVFVYQADWSPDGRYIAFTSGPKAEKKLALSPAIISVKAPGWNICVADANGSNRFVQITTDGNSNKEPDWTPLPSRK
jgi:Tol biopolymer transport system component